jgi:hypothetical protein
MTGNKMKLISILLILATFTAQADPSEYEEILKNREYLDQIGRAGVSQGLAAKPNTSMPIKQAIEAGSLAYSLSNIQNPNGLAIAGALAPHFPGSLSESLSRMGWR